MQEAFDLRDNSTFRAASGLHGGIGGKGDVCGALLGASLMLGLMFGKDLNKSNKPMQPHKPGELDVPLRLVSELYKWFKKEFGSVKCRSIRKSKEKEVDAEPDAAGLTDMEKMNRIYEKCDRLTGKTAARTAEMIYDEMTKTGKKPGETK